MSQTFSKYKRLNELGLVPSNEFQDNPFITNITVDSRIVKKGYLFAAMPGSKYHGISFVKAAIDLSLIHI